MTPLSLTPLSLTPLLKYEWIQLRRAGGSVVLRRHQVGRLADEIISHISGLVPVEDHHIGPDPDCFLTFYASGKVPECLGYIGFFSSAMERNSSVWARVGDKVAGGHLNPEEVRHRAGADLTALVYDVDAIGEALRDSPKEFTRLNLTALGRLGDNGMKYLHTIEEFSKNQDKDIARAANRTLKKLLEHR